MFQLRRVVYQIYHIFNIVNQPNRPAPNPIATKMAAVEDSWASVVAVRMQICSHKPSNRTKIVLYGL